MLSFQWYKSVYIIIFCMTSSLTNTWALDFLLLFMTLWETCVTPLIIWNSWANILYGRSHSCPHLVIQHSPPTLPPRISVSPLGLQLCTNWSVPLGICHVLPGRLNPPNSKVKSQVHTMLFPMLENVRASWGSGNNCPVPNSMLFVTSSPRWHGFSKSLTKPPMRTESSPLALNHSSIEGLKLFLFFGTHLLISLLCLTQFNPITSVNLPWLSRLGYISIVSFHHTLLIPFALLLFNDCPSRV